jgi:glutamate-ammonia-ligase adenylyltransferase
MMSIGEPFTLAPDFMPPGFPAAFSADRSLWSVLEAAGVDAPYLARGMRRRPELAAILGASDPHTSLSNLLARCLSVVESLSHPDTPLEAARRSLRQCKEVVHLAIAAADLSGVLSQNATTAALSAFADASVEAALALACHSQNQPIEGLFILAMGKHGAHELNYSSDIDLIALYDPEVFAPNHPRQQQHVVKIVQILTSVLGERTPEGYVFRVDLRLRPDPNSTTAAVSTRFALGYYEAQGQTWERMAFIKARCVAGDRVAAERFLSAMSPFIWRRNLDYWALADIHAIKRQIHAHHRHGALTQAGFDAKLGRGGIREIEFFAQTQQLILGGRPEGQSIGLRAASTRQALEGLVHFGSLKPATAQSLWADYCTLRLIEHRCQLIEDEQTHEVPEDPSARLRIARLSGVSDLATFDRLTAELRRRVHTEYARLFQAEDTLGKPLEGAPKQASFVFTGVEPDPATVSTLRTLGFSAPERIIASVQDWHWGRVRAARTPRGRQILTLLTPHLLVAMSQTGEPDLAFQRFEDFIRELRAGAQALSLFLAQPKIMAETLASLTLAPRMALDLARQPALIDALLTPQFFTPVPKDPPDRVRLNLSEVAAASPDYESMLDRMRRAHREDLLRLNWQTLNGMLDVATAGRSFAELADATVSALMPGVIKAVEAKLGPMPGTCAVLALGSFGGREMHAGSDLDLMLVYDAPEDAQMSGVFFSRLMQRLISAVSAPTGEGKLYAVDMQLRPNGNAGPAAVRLSSYEAYYNREAWTWELMALTRMRPVWGPPDLCARISQIAEHAVTAAAEHPDKIRADIADMRRKLAQHRAAKSIWDFKLTAGGLVDIEFLAQQGQLLSGRGSMMSPNTVHALKELAGHGYFTQDESETLIATHRLLTGLRQVLTICLQDDAFDPAVASKGLFNRLFSVAKTSNLAGLETLLRQNLQTVAAIRAAQICALNGDGNLKAPR